MRRLKGNISIRVEVGGVCSNMQCWTLPKDLLVYHSRFFAGALSGSFSESSGVVTLPEDDPSIFELFVQWLYVGKGYLSKLWRDCKPEYPATCIAAWTLGDKLGCLAFRDFVMICLINLYYEDLDLALRPSTIRLAYDNSAPGSRLRRWTIDEFISDVIFGYEGDDVLEAEQLRDLEDWGYDLSIRMMTTPVNETGFPEPFQRGNSYLEVLKFDLLDWFVSPASMSKMNAN